MTTLIELATAWAALICPPPLRSDWVARARAGKLNYKDVTRAEEEDLIARYKAGDSRAGEVLLAMHAGLIYKSVKRYIIFGREPEDDILQEARIGFLRGVDKYDISRGSRLSTYASHSSKRGGQDCHGNGGTIRVPLKREQDPVKRDTDSILRKLASIDAPVGEGRSVLGDMFSDDGPSPEDEVESAELAAIVASAMADLPERERETLRDVVMGNSTLDEVGKRHGVSRERIRQLKEKGLETVRRRLGKTLGIDSAPRERSRVADYRIAHRKPPD